MKILGIILAVLLLTLSALVGVLGTNKAFDFADKAAAAAKAGAPGVPSAGRLKAGGAVGILSGLAAIGAVVLLFVKREKAPLVAAVSVGLALVGALIYPSFEVGELSGMAPRPQEFLALGMAVVGAGGAFLAHKKSA